MAKNDTLNAAQLERLAPYERHFRSAISAAWSPWPGEEGIAAMRAVWQELTGTPYNYNAGCAGCLLALVRDVGTLYFRSVEGAKAPDAPGKASETPADETNAAPAPKPSTGRKNAGKSKKSAK